MMTARVLTTDCCSRMACGSGAQEKFRKTYRALTRPLLSMSSCSSATVERMPKWKKCGSTAARQERN